MDRSAHIVVVEDDREISGLVQRFLIQNGYRVSAATDGHAMDRILSSSRADLIVLDVMLPGEDGLSICRRLNVTTKTPVIMLTARGTETDRIVGLEIGADDYVPKPFNPRELLARIRSVLRRAGELPTSFDQNAPAIFSFDGWRVDLGLRRLHSPEGIRVRVTSGEFDLLVAFCQHPKQILTRDQLLDLTRGRTSNLFDRAIDIQVSRLRRKIEVDPKDPKLIQTVRFGGYMFSASVQQSEPC
jgi:two-component system OmpR family response regulator